MIAVNWLVSVASRFPRQAVLHVRQALSASLRSGVADDAGAGDVDLEQQV
jgi:hypothetical protein